MRFIALVSGGKDSIYTILQAIQNGHELLGCLHLGAPETTEEESYMYQTAASSCIRTLVEECLDVDCLIFQRKGKSLNTGLVYEANSEQDEVEDLYLALKEAKQKFSNLEAVCSGAILSTYQRVRIENVCSRLGLTSLSYLWRLKPQKELLQQMLEDGIEAVLVKTACPPGLLPRKHLNKTLRFLWDSGLLERLHERFQFHVCGEGGEYESLVIDSPLHRKKLVLDEVEIVEREDDGVGELLVLKCHAEDKGKDDVPILQRPKHSSLSQQQTQTAQQESAATHAVTNLPSTLSIPHIHQGSGGLLHVSELMASVVATDETSQKTEAELAVEEAGEIFTVLGKTLQLWGASAQDVIFVHLYLSKISHFATINAHYQEFFGTLLPPSRSCVAVGSGVLPGGRQVLLDCMVQLGSGDYMRSIFNPANAYASAAGSTKSSILREVLHVQSISHWAPICVGPYSQANTIRSGLQFLAGQIGLIPSTMTLHSTWTAQLEQCWKNIASVLDALNGGSLNELISTLVYVSEDVYSEQNFMAKIATISNDSIAANGSVVPGKIDSLLNASEFDGYEDEGTWREEMKSKGLDDNATHPACPALLVCIPEMPKGALVEIEVITCTRDAGKCVEMRDSQVASRVRERSLLPHTPLEWDTGHSFPICSQPVNELFEISSFSRVLGYGTAGMVVALASLPVDAPPGYSIQANHLLADMLASAEQCLADARSGLSKSNILHIRLFYVASEHCRDHCGRKVVRDDGVHLRTSLHGLVGSFVTENPPSTTVVPVLAIDSFGTNLYRPEASDSKIGKLAMQVFLADPVHLETEIWIHKDREYAT
jgi:diphthine-ammonia ligase